MTAVFYTIERVMSPQTGNPSGHKKNQSNNEQRYLFCKQAENQKHYGEK
jgi:hypothetical protein